MSVPKYFLRDVKKVREAISKVKQANELYTSDKEEHSRGAAWLLFYAASDLMKDALIELEVNGGLTKEASDEIFKKIQKATYDR